MKLQLNEETLNAYITEAIRQEVNEAGAGAIRKLGQAAGGEFSKMARKKTPFNFIKNTKVAKNARLGLRDFRRGKAIEGKIGKGSFKGNSYFVRNEGGVTKFYQDAACTKPITDPGMLKSAKSSWRSLTSHAKNVRNSARRNMAGTAAVAGLGTAAALGGRGGHEDDPWNEPEPGNTPEPTAPDNGGFPWDDTEPVWTPRPNRPAPQPVQEPTAPAEQPQRQPMEPLQPVTPPANLPTGVTGPQQTIQMREPQSSLLGNASQAMVNAASTSPATASQREQSRAIRQTYRNARNAMNRDDYGPTAQQDKQTLKNVKNAVLRGNQHPSLEEGKIKLTEAQLHAYLNEAINEELDEIFGWSRSELNQKYGYQWDPNKSAAQNRAARRANKYDMRSKGYRNAQEYEAGEGHAYNRQQQQVPQQNDNYDYEESQDMGFVPGQPAPFANEKYKVGQFQTWFNQNMGGKLVVDGIWGPRTQAAWDQWVNQQQGGTMNE